MPPQKICHTGAVIVGVGGKIMVVHGAVRVARGRGGAPWASPAASRSRGGAASAPAAAGAIAAPGRPPWRQGPALQAMAASRAFGTLFEKCSSKIIINYTNNSIYNYYKIIHVFEQPRLS